MTSSRPSGGNPFHYGSPAGKDHFADREAEKAGIVDRMLNGQNVILLSPRRYGKTSLLRRSMDEVRRAGGRTGYVSLLGCSSRKEVAEAIVAGVLNGPLSWIARRREEVGRALARIRMSPSAEIDAEGRIRVSLSPAPGGSEDWAAVLGDALRMLLGAAEGGHAVSFVFDEFQRVAEIHEGLAGVFKATADELWMVSLVFAGSKQHLMERIATGPGAPLLGMGERITLGLIPEPDMVDYLCRRARTGGKPMSKEVAAGLYRRVDGIPNEVQRLAYASFFAAGSVIDEAAVKAAMQRVIDHQATDYAERFTRLGPAQQRVLKALARRPVEAVYSSAFMGEVEVANANSVRKALAVLSEMEMVRKQPGGWQVSDAFLRGWLATLHGGL